MISKYTKSMKCKYCGNEMELDDVDYNFKGNQDDYLICDCGASCVVKVRYDKICKKEWEKNND